MEYPIQLGGESRRYLLDPVGLEFTVLEREMRSKKRLTATLFLIRVLVGGADLAADPGDYLQKIKPLLADRCYACHGPLRQEGGLRLDTAAFAIQGGDSGAAVKPGDAPASLLIRRITEVDESERMPLDGQPLGMDQIDAIRTWIAQNAEAPADEKPEPDPREHWAFRPLVRPPIPKVKNTAWVRNPIDAFIAHKHEQLGLIPQLSAPHEVFLRRLTFDLVGLPPSEEEMSRLDVGSTETGYEHFVQYLLDDLRHGERWARHWMDIWRYSDWWGLGDQLRNSQPHIWHWRDWIVESLNANIPYDQMVRLMLAADELRPNDMDALRATGFLGRNYFLFNRNQWMDETVEHVSKGLLGLTLNCAKCHDHKYDPFPQIDYYRMRAFFEPYHVRLDIVPLETDLARDGIPRVFDAVLDAPTYRFERGQESQPDTSQLIAPGVPELFAFTDLRIEPVVLPKEAWQPERRPWVFESYLSAARKNVSIAEAALASVRTKLASPDEGRRATCEDGNREISAHLAAVANAVSEPDTATVADIATLKAELHVAELAADVARAELNSVENRIAAMRAAWAQADDLSAAPHLVEAERTATMEAVRAERYVVVIKGRHQVADLELRLSHTETDKKEALEKELSASRESLVKAEQSAAAIVTSDDRYSPLVGAKWTPTRFLSSERDDPPIEFAAQSTGRRSALATWITHPRNPLTARVAVNHIWARHMGTPLVPSVFDFGHKGTPPVYPELLDWMASELIDSGWNMKHLHKLIVLSSSYRMSSSNADCATNLLKDPENIYLWRREPIRLESQVIRDSILSLAGTLDLARGGPPILAADQNASKRRSLYFFHSNNDRNSFLSMFDEAAVKECYVRDQSIIPQQALAMTNSRLVLDAARQIADRLSRAPSFLPRPLDDRQFVTHAFKRILGISANEDEIRASMEALEVWRKQPDATSDHSSDRARENLVWVLLNHNDFVTVR